MGVLKHGRLFAAMGAAMFLLAMFAILGPLRPVELLQDDKSTQYYFGPVFRSRKIPVIPADSGPLSRLAARTVADTLAEALPDIQVELRELQDSAPVPPPEPLAGVEPLLVACSDSPLFPEDHTPPQSVVAVRLDTLDRALSHHCRAWPFAASSVNGIYFHGARLAGSGVLMRNRAVRQAARKLAGEFLQAWKVAPDTVCDLTEELQAFAAPENRFGELGGQLLLAGSDPTRSCFEIRRYPLTGTPEETGEQLTALLQRNGFEPVERRNRPRHHMAASYEIDFEGGDRLQARLHLPDWSRPRPEKGSFSVPLDCALLYLSEISSAKPSPEAVTRFRKLKPHSFLRAGGFCTLTGRTLAEEFDRVAADPQYSVAELFTLYYTTRGTGQLPVCGERRSGLLTRIADRLAEDRQSAAFMNHMSSLRSEVGLEKSCTPEQEAQLGRLRPLLVKLDGPELARTGTAELEVPLEQGAFLLWISPFLPTWPAQMLTVQNRPAPDGKPRCRFEGWSPDESSGASCSYSRHLEADGRGRSISIGPRQSLSEGELHFEGSIDAGAGKFRLKVRYEPFPVPPAPPRKVDVGGYSSRMDLPGIAVRRLVIQPGQPAPDCRRAAGIVAECLTRNLPDTIRVEYRDPFLTPVTGSDWLAETVTVQLLRLDRKPDELRLVLRTLPFTALPYLWADQPLKLYAGAMESSQWESIYTFTPENEAEALKLAAAGLSVSYPDFAIRRFLPEYLSAAPSKHAFSGWPSGTLLQRGRTPEQRSVEIYFIPFGPSPAETWQKQMELLKHHGFLPSRAGRKLSASSVLPERFRVEHVDGRVAELTLTDRREPQNADGLFLTFSEPEPHAPGGERFERFRREEPRSFLAAGGIRTLTGPKLSETFGQLCRTPELTLPEKLQLWSDTGLPHHAEIAGARRKLLTEITDRIAGINDLGEFCTQARRLLSSLKLDRSVTPKQEAQLGSVRRYVLIVDGPALLEQRRLDFPLDKSKPLPRIVLITPFNAELPPLTLVAADFNSSLPDAYQWNLRDDFSMNTLQCIAGEAVRDELPPGTIRMSFTGLSGDCPILRFVYRPKSKGKQP